MHHLNTGHQIDFDSSKQIAQVKDHFVHTIRKVFETRKMGKLHQRNDILNILTVWKTVLKRHDEDASFSWVERGPPNSDVN